MSTVFLKVTCIQDQSFNSRFWICISSSKGCLSSLLLLGYLAVRAKSKLRSKQLVVIFHSWEGYLGKCTSQGHIRAVYISLINCSSLNDTVFWVLREEVFTRFLFTTNKEHLQSLSIEIWFVFGELNVKDVPSQPFFHGSFCDFNMTAFYASLYIYYNTATI